MGEKSYLLGIIDGFATFEDSGWKAYAFDEIRTLEKAKEDLGKERIMADKLRTEIEQLKAYVDTLERQLSLASHIISKTSKMKFPIYTQRRRWRKNG